MYATKENLSNAQMMPELTEKNASRIVAVCNKQIQIYHPLNNVVECSVPSDCGSFFTPTLFGEKVIFVFWNGKVKCFDLNTNAWHDLARTLTASSQCSIATINDYVYAVGGFENGKPLNTVARWNLKSNEWNSVARMNQGRRSHCTVILNGKLYAIGGIANNTILNSVECYDPIADSWSACSPLVTARSNTRAVVANNDIFVFGGYTRDLQKRNSIEKYNADADTWMEVAAMRCERREMGAYLFNNKIYLLGGYSWESKQWLNSVEEFDPVTNECRLIDHLNIEIGKDMHCFPYL